MRIYRQIILILIALFMMSSYLFFSGYTPFYLEKNKNIDFWPKKTYAPPVFDIVLCGDSRVLRGVSPTVVSNTLYEYNVLNFGYSSTIFDRVYLEQAKAKLNPDGKKIYVLGLSSHSFTDKENESLISNLGIKYNKSYYKLKKIEQVVFPSISIKNFVKLILGRYKFTMPSYYQMHLDNGWIASDRKNKENIALKNYVETFSKYQFDYRKLNELKNFISYEKKNGAVFFSFRVPVSDEMIELEDNLSGADFNYIKNVLEDVGSYWIDIPDIGLRSYDGSHLDYRSAEKLSIFLAKKIKNKI